MGAHVPALRSSEKLQVRGGGSGSSRTERNAKRARRARGARSASGATCATGPLRLTPCAYLSFSIEH